MSVWEYDDNKHNSDVDWDLPIVPQVMRLTDYLNFIATPKILDRPARLFHNPILEYISRNHWYAIPATWGPVACWLCLRDDGKLSYGARAALCATGIATWTLMEYILHRWLARSKHG